MFATPVGYLIEHQGIITNDVAAGVQPILDLVSANGMPTNGQGTAPVGDRAQTATR